jgi:ABC-type ATPase with predicted acetyltransferase domain
MDEFCATLDRETAKIVAFNVQKQARRMGRAVIVATTHTDLFKRILKRRYSALENEY